MTHFLYNTVLAVASPFIALWLRGHPRYRDLNARFDPPVPRLDARPLWVQACSVGEVNTARPIVAALQERFPGVPVLLTSSTLTGRDLARQACPHLPTTWFPFDTRGAVRRFLDKAHPRALVLVETELWPNVLYESRRRGIPVVLVNGRLSDKHYPRYRQFRLFFGPVFQQLSAVGAQNAAYQQRFISLGVDPRAIRATGNTKFDGVATAVDVRTRTRLKVENGFPADHPILLFGSTRPGDEALAAACWGALRAEMPNLHLVVAPRHLERLDEAIASFDEPVIRRSQIRAGRKPAGERIFVLDTLGELVSFYSIATVAVVGGSFYPGVNGHNPLEPAALGVPTVFGPYMSNFMDPARVLLAAKGAIQVSGPEDLCAALDRLLADPAEQRRLGTRARRAVLAHRGAIARNVDLIEAVLKQGSTPHEEPS